MVFRVFPREVIRKSHAIRQLLRYPPTGLRLIQGVDGWLPNRNEWTFRGCDDGRRIITLQVGRFRENKIGVVSLFNGQDIDDGHELQLFNGFQSVLSLRNALQNVLSVHNPALDRIRARVHRGLHQALRKPLWTPRLPMDIWFLRRQRAHVSDSGIGEKGNSALLHFGGQEHASFAAISSEQGSQNGHGASTLRIVAVPSDVPSRVIGDGRFGLCHHVSGFANLRDWNLGDRFRPFRAKVFCVSFEFLYPCGVLLDVLLVVEILSDENVRPCSNSAISVPGA